MSFKCSVFGHAYGDSEIERDRVEDGSEVVTTIRETQTCKRCDETRVVSENKEVTTLETAADIVAEDLDEDGTAEAAEADDAEPPEPPAEPANDGAEVMAESELTDEPETEPTTPVQEAESQPPTPVEAEPTEETDPETDDGVILEEEQEPDVPDREVGAWPEEPDEGDDQWEPETEVDPTPDQQEVEPTASAVTVPEGEFHCPECEFTTSVAESSLRRGDFCPECHRGALEHVTE